MAQVRCGSSNFADLVLSNAPRGQTGPTIIDKGGSPVGVACIGAAISAIVFDEQALPPVAQTAAAVSDDLDANTASVLEIEINAGGGPSYAVLGDAPAGRPRLWRLRCSRAGGAFSPAVFVSYSRGISQHDAAITAAASTTPSACRARPSPALASATFRFF
jgi:hypothetical protein